ncbi:hypothetical protein NOK12_13040 [Nocardioides sp. OK12]|uniref:choice-of-anchor P family protein n=1 Tax=Nocardioides sp. OK12 TaxID=2758661 RepID=UPI0021C3E3B1|nr:choice-of-anchor P family protein [Nocardioides sp. OK12]GHJ58786.1 hypothetical protein NOK12_13040 [Nocardioides sp. OK12]
MSRQTTTASVRRAGGPRRVLLSLAATALVGTALPLAAAPGPAGAAEGDPAFAGYVSTTSATPVRIEIYESTIPIPASPQAELNMGYSTVKADSSTSRGRASFMWPGDAVGEGFKTIVENFGLPPELAGPIGENGYPFQVNSVHPAGPPREADEPFPGVINRTGASEGRTFAEVGYSTDCRLGEPGAGSEDGGGGDGDGDGDAPGLPGLPGIPGLPDIPGLGALTGGLTEALAGGLAGGSRAASQEPTARERRTARVEARADEDEVECQIPTELAALVDIGGYAAESVVTNDSTQVRAVSRSAVGDVSLLGGVVTLSGITARAVAASDGAKGTTGGGADYGVLTIAGQKFRYGADGFEAAGQAAPVPGLPSDPGAALEALGIQLLLPQPSYEKDGDKATTTVQGIQVVIDTTILRGQLDALPLNALADLINQIPEEAGQLKAVLGSAINLAPRFVITLGNATSVVDTSQPVDIPTGEVPDNNTTGEPGDPTTAGGGGSATTGGGGTGTAGTPGTPGEPAVPGSDGSGDGDLVDAAPTGAGLPPLFSIPGALLFGGIIGATIAGSYLRRLGVLALGGVGACPHGLDSGLPDLRKA